MDGGTRNNNANVDGLGLITGLSEVKYSMLMASLLADEIALLEE